MRDSLDISITYYLRAIAILALMAAQPASSCGFVSSDINGTIVDAKTGKPIAGVVVTASWMLRGYGSSRPFKTLKASETVTDDWGQYTILGWGAEASPDGHLEDGEPNIRFFKPSYVPLVIRNNSVYHPGLEKDREHMIKEKITHHDGKTYTNMYEPEQHQVRFGKKSHAFKLEPFEGTDGEYVEVLKENFNVHDRYISSLKYLKSGRECVWRQLPITFIALEKLKARLDKNNVNTNYIPGFSALGGQNQKCGKVEEVYREYLE